MRLVLAIVAMLAGFSSATAQASSDTSRSQSRSGMKAHGSSTEAALLRLEAQWDSAWIRRDVTPFRRILADDYIGTTGDGKVESKDAFITRAQGAQLENVTGRDARVRVYGSAAVVSRELDILARDSAGTRQSGRLRATDTFVRRGGRWQLVAHQVTEVADSASAK